jgi:hypothetical protein
MKDIGASNDPPPAAGCGQSDKLNHTSAAKRHLSAARGFANAAMWIGDCLTLARCGSELLGKIHLRAPSFLDRNFVPVRRINRFFAP